MDIKFQQHKRTSYGIDGRDESLPIVESWQGKWIWLKDRGDGKHDYICFRKEFFLQSQLENPVIHITAEQEYSLWINGIYAGRGPGLCDPRFKRYNTYRIKKLLQQGKNIISVLVCHHWEKDSSWRRSPYQESCGLLCQIDDNNKTILISDKTWKTTRHLSWKRPGVTRFEQMPGNQFDDTTFPEWYDSRVFPEDWKSELFDDSKWDYAITCIPEKYSLCGQDLPQARFFPWVNLIPSEIVNPSLNKCFPISISFGEVLQRRDFSIEDTAVRMSLEEVKPCTKAYVQNAEKLCKPDGESVIVCNSDPYENEETFDGYRNATIIFDFGRLMNARFSFKLKSAEHVKIDIGYSWNLEEGRVVPYVSYRTPQADCYIAKEGIQEWQTYQWRHFRYVQITFRDLFEPLEIFEIWAEEVEYPFLMNSSFSSDNDLLNCSWKATENTVKLCCTDQTMDNPSREKKQWSGDCSSIIPAIDSLFGNTALVKKYFHQFDESQHRTGLYRISTNHDNDNFALFDHSLFIPIRLYDHYMKFADKKLIARMLPGIRNFMNLTESILNQEGIAVLPPYALFYDWAFIKREDISFLLNAMVAKAFLCSAQLAMWANDKDGIDFQWKQRGERIQSFLQEHFFDKERGVFVDRLFEDGKQDSFVSEHSNSLAVVWGIANIEQADRIMSAYAKDRKLFSSTSPAWHYIPECFIHAHRMDLMMDWLKRKYEPIFNSGYDTLPETWCLYGENSIGRWRSRNSRAVAQGAGIGLPNAVVNGIVGIKPLKPGFKEIEVYPCPGELEYFNIQIPGPDGYYSLAYQAVGNVKEYRITLPDPRPVQFFVSSKEILSEITVNGEKMIPESQAKTYNNETEWGFMLSGADEFVIKAYFQPLTQTN